MPHRVTSIALAFLVTGSIGALLRAQSGLPPATPVSFAKDVQRILENSCLPCHGETMQMGKLDLRSRESALQGGAHGAVLLPANAERSRLYRMVAGLEQPSMPMSGNLTARDIATLKAWIDQGAKWDGATLSSSTKPSAAALAALENRPITPEERSYWAFKPPVRAPLPVVDSRRLTNPLDRFLERARQEHGLNADAERVGAPHRHAAGLASLWRALRPPLARRGALCRFGRVRVRHASTQCVAVPRLRHQVVQ